jgi:DNA-binding NtrC family response regulator
MNPKEDKMSTVLIVDDEIEVCKALELFLTKKGYRVSIAADGTSALELVKENKPDIVLLDIIMPGMWGTDVLKQIKKIDPLINVIMTTAVGDTNEIEKALKGGALDYLIKPLDLRKLADLLDKLIRESRV